MFVQLLNSFQDCYEWEGEKRVIASQFWVEDKWRGGKTLSDVRGGETESEREREREREREEWGTEEGRRRDGERVGGNVIILKTNEKLEKS